MSATFAISQLFVFGLVTDAGVHAACSVSDNVIPPISQNVSAWITSVRECKSQNPMKNWSLTDGAKGCGWTKDDGSQATPSSPGQPCKIKYMNNAQGIGDGMCVKVGSDEECWALLNDAHKPCEFNAACPADTSAGGVSGGSCSVSDNVIPAISQDLPAWITAVRKCKAQNPMKSWSSTDGAKGCGWTKDDGSQATPSSPGQPCKIKYMNNGQGIGDGMCVKVGSDKECWAVLNEAHKPCKFTDACASLVGGSCGSTASALIIFSACFAALSGSGYSLVH